MQSEAANMHAYDVVVLAADGLLGAGAVAANTDDGEGRAVETELRGRVLEDDIEQREKGSARSRVGLRKCTVHRSAGLEQEDFEKDETGRTRSSLLQH